MISGQGSEGYSWRPVPPAEILRWNERLAGTSASFRQYPFWTEMLRRVGFNPLYVACYQGKALHGFVAILTARALWARVGLIEKGPVGLGDDGQVDPSAMEELCLWARSRGIMFLRIICQPETGKLLMAAGAKREDLFPLYGSVSLHEMLVRLREDEDAMLSSFQSTARYEIRTAQKLGYVIHRSESPEDLLRNWGMFHNLALRKKISFLRGPEAWAEVLRRGAPIGKAALYIAEYHQKVVQLALVVRAGEIAEYMIGAMDPNLICRKASPACLLHWTAMRDALRAGYKFYDLGTPSGPVVQFKRKFRPEERRTLDSYTLPCRSFSCSVWSNLALPVMLPIWPSAKRLIAGTLQAARNSRARLKRSERRLIPRF